MHILRINLLALTLLASATAFAMDKQPTQEIIVTPANSTPAQKGPAEYFSGDVTIDNPFNAEAPGRVFGATVNFAPGSRTAWHTHPLGQILVVTEGSGFVQREGEEAQSITVGDVVWIPADVKHWHGASSGSGMTHIAIVEQQDGVSADWMELVSDEDYKTAQ